jgi:hypothetical protein
MSHLSALLLAVLAEVEGERVSAYSNALPPLKPNGRSLMFAKYEPETKAFYTTDAYAVFEVRDARTYSLWPLHSSGRDLSITGVVNGALFSVLSNLRCRSPSR